MRLLPDLIDPATITGFAREEVDAYDAGTGTLSEIFPSETTDDLTVEWLVGKRDEDVATYRAFDAEASIGGGGGGEKRTAGLAAVARKYRFSEYDQLIRRGINSPETVEQAAEKLATKAAKAVVNRQILARGEVLATGKLVIREDGFFQTADYGRRADFTATAATLWDGGGDVLADLETWTQAYEDVNGVLPEVAYVSRRVATALLRSEKVRAYMGTNAPSVITLEDVNRVIIAQGYTPLTVVSARVDGRAVLPDDRLILARASAGATVWGPTLEATDPAYGLEFADQPGLYVGAYGTDDPKATWIRGNATVLPVLHDADATFAAKVVA